VEKLFSSFRRSTSVFALVAMLAGTTGALADSFSSIGDYTTVSITDGKDFISSGTSSLYVIKVSQNAGPARYMDVFVELPAYTTAAYADNDGRVNGNRVVWSKVSLAPGEEKIFTVQVNFAQAIPGNTVLTAKVQADGMQDTDTTEIRTGIPSTSFVLSVTDNRDQVYPGQNLSYVVRVKNTSGIDVTTDVSAILSGLNEVTTMSDGGILNYPSISWKSVFFKAGEEKTFTFNASMRERVAPYTAARVIAHVGSLTATDTTTSISLHGDPVFITSTQLNNPSSRVGATSSSTTLTPSRTNVLFRSTSDANDVVRGGAIHYTLYVKNVLLNVIRDGMITVRYNPNQVSVVDANGGTVLGDGRIQFKVPVLQPGASWTVTYAMKVSKTLPTGAIINNVATLDGNDVGATPLSQRATVNNADVLVNLPTTGAAFDLLFALLTAPLALAGAMMQRKLR
jgi:hypothetical protein